MDAKVKSDNNIIHALLVVMVTPIPISFNLKPFLGQEGFIMQNFTLLGFAVLEYLENKEIHRLTDIQVLL